MRRRQDIRRDLARLGVRSGDIVMAHASLRRIGPVEGRAQGVLDALDGAIGDGALLMTLGAEDAWSWVNARPEAERIALLADAPPFDPLTTPADPDVGYLAEAFRGRAGTLVTDNPEGRFGARGFGARALLEGAPWDDYYGPGSPLERLCAVGGMILRLGADVDTVTALHYAEYLAPVEGKRRVRRHRKVLGAAGPEVRTVECLDDSDGIVDWPGEDYFATILKDYLALGRARTGLVGGAQSELIDAADIVAFAADWMAARFS